MHQFFSLLGLEMTVKLICLAVVGSLDIWLQVLVHRHLQATAARPAMAVQHSTGQSHPHAQLHRIAARQRAAVRLIAEPQRLEHRHQGWRGPGTWHS